MVIRALEAEYRRRNEENLMTDKETEDTINLNESSSAAQNTRSVGQYTRLIQSSP
jgi:hypothetical protein